MRFRVFLLATLTLAATSLLPYYQFDMVFLEEVEDENGNAFYEVVDSPDGADVVELEGS